jgi:hypothetical protein
LIQRVKACARAGIEAWHGLEGVILRLSSEFQRIVIQTVHRRLSGPGTIAQESSKAIELAH